MCSDFSKIAKQIEKLENKFFSTILISLPSLVLNLSTPFFNLKINSRNNMGIHTGVGLCNTITTLFDKLPY